MTTRTAEEAKLPNLRASVRPRLEKQPNASIAETQQDSEPAETLDGLDYNPPPPPHHLDIHGWNPKTIFENLDDAQKALWIAEPGEKVLAYKAYGGRIEGSAEAIELGDLIKTRLNLQDDPVVATPVPAIKSRKHLPPLCALIGGIPPVKARGLLNMVSANPLPQSRQRKLTPAQKFLSTPSLTVFFIPFEPEPTNFVVTLKGFIFTKETKEQTEWVVKGIVEQALFFGDENSATTTATKRMLANHRDKIPIPLNINVQEAIRYLVASTVVKRHDLVRKEDIGTGEGKGDPVWNVYIAPPTANHSVLLEWITMIRETKFVTTRHKAGEARKPFTCSVCHSEDHPGGMCRYPREPDWITPQPSTSPALSSLLNATQPKSTNPNPPSKRGGHRGGHRSKGSTSRSSANTRA